MITCNKKQGQLLGLCISFIAVCMSATSNNNNCLELLIDEANVIKRLLLTTWKIESQLSSIFNYTWSLLWFIKIWNRILRSFSIHSIPHGSPTSENSISSSFSKIFDLEQQLANYINFINIYPSYKEQLDSGWWSKAWI